MTAAFRSQSRQRADLEPGARELFDLAMAWLDRCWDASAGLLRVPDQMSYLPLPPGMTVHLLRESGYYALGLLARNAAGDHARALRVLDTLLSAQFDAPGQPYHGTWPRAPEEPAPPPDPQVWRDYDPNWREFIGTTLALMLDYAPRLPEALVRRIDAALLRAIEGALARRVPASYTNIALMCAFLLAFGAHRFDRPDWLHVAGRYADEIYRLFAQHGAFEEYNSPTYYGVDLYALALWRSCAEPLLRERGAALEAALWRDIARYYHAGMRNLAGPYGRSYGMDMRCYAAALGLWIWLAAGRAQAPFPDPELPFAHAWDFAAAVPYALLGAQVPPDALPHFQAFQGERQVTQVISAMPRRVATAWIGERLMLGAEEGNDGRNRDQFHPATVHWLCPDGEVGWIRLRHAGPLDARAERGVLAIICTQHAGGDQEFVFQISAAGIVPEGLRHDRWLLPGLVVEATTDADSMSMVWAGSLAEVHYQARNRMANAPLHLTLRFADGAAGGDREPGKEGAC